MSVAYFTSDQPKTIYREADLQCAELAREQGPVTAVQMNLIAARIMEAARDNCSPQPEGTIKPAAPVTPPARRALS